MSDDPRAESGLDAEFDAMAGWVAEAVRSRAARYAVPAACRGTGGPRVLTWLLDRMALAPGATLLDVGAGLGGPAAFARDRDRVRPVLLEPEPAAARAAGDLFGMPVARADAETLPLRDNGFDAVWSLGVLCTTPHQADLVAELARVVRPGGAVGLMVLVTPQDEALVAPTGNVFPPVAEVERMAGAAGLVIQDTAETPVDDPLPADWAEAEATVLEEVGRRHGDHPAYRAAKEQEALMGELVAQGLVRRLLLTARAGEVDHGR